MTFNINDMVKNSYENVSSEDMLRFAQRVIVGDGPANDAFCRFRTSTPTITFENYEIQGKKTLNWSESLTGAATIAHVANQSALKFETSAANGDKATRSSKKLSLYTPGTSLLIMATGVMGAGANNSCQRIGLFNAQNGVFFEQRNQVMGVVIRSFTSGSAVDNRVAQSDWNIDRMDGTGASGVTLDFTKTQIFFIDLEWLGVGRVRCGFVHNGSCIICHEFYHNNSLSTVYMTTPMLPITYEVENTAASTALSDFRQICCTMIVEGDLTVSHQSRTINNGISTRATTTTTGLPILSLRMQTAYVGKAMIKPSNIDVLTQGTKDHLFEIIYNGTLESSSFSNAPGIGMIDTSATHVTGGTRLGSVYTSSDSRFNQGIFDHLLWLGGELAGTSDTLTVVARALSGTVSSTAAASIDYEEFY